MITNKIQGMEGLGRPKKKKKVLTERDIEPTQIDSYKCMTYA